MRTIHSTTLQYEFEDNPADPGFCSTTMPLSMPEHQLHARSMMLPAAFTLMGVFLRGYLMDRALGGQDENAMLMYFGYSYPEYITSNYFDANNHIFHTLLANLMSQWFGEENALAIRFPTFIFGIACLWMIYLTALELFHSRNIAAAALLIAAVNPVHIHYSQTARGYSLVMFFSIACVYYSLKLLRPGNHWKYGLALAVCGFLSVYTLPTNIFFLSGLAVWLGAVLMVPRLMEEYGISGEARRNIAVWFFGAGALMTLAGWLAYSPVLQEMLETARAHPLLTVDTQTGSAAHLAPAILETIFQGPLLWFLPFLVAGLFSGPVVHRARLLLLAIIFFVPLFISLVTGVGGYPRNYLFNLPLLVLFLAAGFVKAGEWVEQRIGNGERNRAAWAFTALYATVSMGVVIFEYYPSVRVPDPAPYRQNVRQQADPHDLLLIGDPKNYMYARTTYGDNLPRIIHDNSLTGVKAIIPVSANIEDYEIQTAKGALPLLKGLLNPGALPAANLDGARKMVSITGPRTVPVLPEDFESDSEWQTVSGSGEVLKISDHVFSGKQSLQVSASENESVVARAPVAGDFSIVKPSLIALIWARKKFDRKTIAYHPILSARTGINGNLQTFQMLTGKINDGINIQIKEQPGDSQTYHWFLNASVGILPPGNYTFQILLKCDAGQRVLYDGLRLFLIELA